MSELMEDVQYLSEKIGARPAGTEEERRSAVYIAEKIQKRSGLSFDIEDFEGSNLGVRDFAVCTIFAVGFTLLGILLPIFCIPSLVIALLAFIVEVLEILGKPIISNRLRHGLSQNVVAKYVPAFSAENQNRQRKRKVILVSHYDTAKSLNCAGDFKFTLTAISKPVSVVGCLLCVVLLVLRAFVFGDATGIVQIWLIVFAIIFGIVAFMPVILSLFRSRSYYNSGANCNASGNAALIEIAKQLGTGAYGGVDAGSEQPTIHGKEVAQAADAIPEGANVVYDNSAKVNAGQKATDEHKKADPLAEKQQSLDDAKAAIAAFTAPRAPRKQYDDDGNLLGADNKPIVTASAPEAEVQTEPEPKVESQETKVINNVPSYTTAEKSTGEVPAWFKAAKEKSKPVQDEEEPAPATQRSRFAHTMDYMAQRQEDERKAKEAAEEEKRNRLRAQIEAAQEAAERERKKAMQDEPFFRAENDNNAKPVEVSAPSKFEVNMVTNQNKNDAQPGDAPRQTTEVKPSEAVKNITDETTKEKTAEVQKTEQIKVDANTQIKPEMSLDERFKVRQQATGKNAKVSQAAPESVKQETTPEAPKTPEPSVEQPASTTEPLDKQENLEKEPPQEGRTDFDLGPERNAFFDKSIGDEKEQTLKPESSEQQVHAVTNPDTSGPLPSDMPKQYAPLADEAFVSSNTANVPKLELPHIGNTGPIDTIDQPSAAGVFSHDSQKIESGKFGTGSFAAISEQAGTAGATGTFAPVTDQLMEQRNENSITPDKDMVVDDADDQVFSEGSFTDTGAFAGRDYVDMPSKKRKGLFGLFDKKDKPAAKHGNHDSKDLQSPIIDDDWEGGAFSNLGAKLSMKKTPKNESEPTADNVDINNPEAQEAPATSEPINAAAKDNGLNIKRVDFSADDGEPRAKSIVDANPEFNQQIQTFKEGAVNIEVWMVALGSELDSNSGMKAFLLEHSQELRGAIIIDIEALGSGELSLVDSEGIFKRSKTPSRIKRYVRSVANKMGMAVPSVKLPWGCSTAAYANRQGYNAMRLVGMDGPKPAYYMQDDDNFENVDEQTLTKNVNFLINLIQSI